MPPKALRRPGTRQALAGIAVGDDVDPSIDRVTSEHTDAIQRLESQIPSRSRMVVDLVVGVNRIAHGLGRKPLYCAVTPTVATAAFGFALLATSDAVVAVVEVVGVDIPGAGVIFE